MRNPNGYGSVVKLSGKRRKPYWARKTLGSNDKGYPIYLTIGYYTTRAEGNIALAEFNKRPYDIDQSKITYEELYALWSNKIAPKLGQATAAKLKSAVKHCSALYGMVYKDIRAIHMQECIDNCGHGTATQSAIRSLCIQLERFARLLGIIEYGHSDLLTIDYVAAPVIIDEDVTTVSQQSPRRPFLDAEIEKLWEHKDEPWVDSILIYMYTGLRFNELRLLESCTVYLNRGFLVTGSKTAAGKGRVVPIHPLIFDLVQARVNHHSKYLLGEGERPVTETTYRNRWKEIMQRLDMSHTIHDCRHTFRTKLYNAGVDELTINLIMGHKSKNVGERVYTHQTIEQLKAKTKLVTS